MLSMISNSVAWEKHMSRHKDAKLVRLDSEETPSMEKKSQRTEEAQFFNYDSLTKHFTAGCQCGQRFDIDLKNDKVESVDPSLKAREISSYDKNQTYGPDRGPEPSYDRGPKRQESYSAPKQFSYKM